MSWARALPAQAGGQHPTAKRRRGDLGDLVKVVEDEASGTYRAVYLARLPEAIYVLHVFKKKATHGIATSRHDVKLIKARLRWAEHHGNAGSES